MQLIQNKLAHRANFPFLRGLLDLILEMPESFRGTPMIEIGSCIGESTRLFSLFFSPVYAVDPLVGGSGVNFREVFTKTTAGRSIVSVPKLSKDAVNDVPGGVSLVYIDGNHRYAFVKEDIKNYLPKIRSDGDIGGHDYVVGSSKRPPVPAKPECSPIEVEKAVNEVLGLPDKIFVDHSWLKKITL